MCANHPKIALPFRFVWLEVFSWFVILFGRIEPITCINVLFGYKNVGKWNHTETHETGQKEREQRKYKICRGDEMFFFKFTYF